MASEIMLVRHGETEWSKARKHTSNTDLDLTVVGREAATRLAGGVAKFEFTEVFSSPLKRAHETAKIVFPQRTIVVSELLREWDYGRYEGITTKEIHETDPNWNLWMDGCPDGESPVQVTNRVDAFLDSVEQVEGMVCVVAHGHILRALTARYLGLSASEGRLFALDTATLSVLGREHDHPVIQSWNNAGFNS